MNLQTSFYKTCSSCFSYQSCPGRPMWSVCGKCSLEAGLGASWKSRAGLAGFVSLLCPGLQRSIPNVFRSNLPPFPHSVFSVPVCSSTGRTHVIVVVSSSGAPFHDAGSSSRKRPHIGPCRALPDNCWNRFLEEGGGLCCAGCGGARGSGPTKKKQIDPAPL